MNQSNMHTKQKRNKRMISMLLLATLLMSLFVISDIKPVNAAEVLAVWVDTEDYPVEGQKLPVIYPENSSNFGVQGDAIVKSAQWYKESESGTYERISENEEITAGKTYYLGIVFVPIHSSDTFSFVNTEFRAFHSTYDNPTYVNKFGDVKEMEVYFKCTAAKSEKEVLEEVHIGGVRDPEIGEKPYFDTNELTWDTTKFDVSEIHWSYPEEQRRLTPSDTFQAGKTYYLYLKIIAKGNYEVKIPKTQSKINGYPAVTSYDPETKEFFAKNRYTLYNTIKAIEISGVREPIDGEIPDKDIKKLTYDGKLYYIDEFTWEGVRDDGSYYNMGDEKFRVGERYAATFIVDDLGNNEIDLNITKGKINGNEATLSKEKDDYLMRMIFTAKPQSDKTYIESLHVILPDECLPVVGQEPEWDVSKYSLQNPPEGVKIKRVEWLKLTTPLKKGDIFQKDEKYTIAFFLDIPEKYVAKSGVTKGHVNSIRTDFLVVKDGPFITYYLTALDTPKTPQKPKQPQQEQPEQPQQPSQPSGNQQYTMHFSDVMPSDWYYNYVKYVYEKGIMNGVGDGKFAPKNNVSRAMIVTMLYRIAKEPAVGGTTNFNDNTGNTWYTNAVKWTAQKGLAKEFIQGNFDPNTLLTREQMITIMYNYQKSRGKSTALANSLGEFKDGYLVSGYAQDAMKWAVKAGIIQGNEQKKLNPTANVTRAEVAAIIQRFNELR